jgi:hypothetical protein
MITPEEAISLTVTRLYEVGAPRESVQELAFTVFLGSKCPVERAMKYAKMTLAAWDKANT